MVRQVMIKTAGSVMFSSFVDELIKISMAAPNPLKALRAGKFSTNIGGGSRSSIKMKMPSVPSAPPVGRVTTVGGSSIATGVPGANLRTPAVGNLGTTQSQLAQQSALRAGPGHIAQSTPAVPMTAQGQPAMVSTPAPTGGTVGGSSTTTASNRVGKG